EQQLVRRRAFRLVPRTVNACRRQFDTRPGDRVPAVLGRQSLEALADPLGQGAPAREKKWHVGAELAGDFGQVRVRSVNSVQRPQRRGRVGAGSPEAGARWDAFVQVDLGGQLATHSSLEGRKSLDDDVVAARGDRKAVGNEGGAPGGRRLDQVVQRDRLDLRLDVVESIAAAPNDFEVQVELGARGQRDFQLRTGRRFARYRTARSW